MYITIAVISGQQLPMLLHCRVHAMVQGWKREPFRFPRNPARYVRKIKEQMCMTNYSHAIFISVPNISLTLPATDYCVICEYSIVSCIIIRVALSFALYSFQI